LVCYSDSLAAVSPIWGFAEREMPPRLPGQRKGCQMRLFRRLAVAAGSVVALVLAGGAHFKF